MKVIKYLLPLVIILLGVAAMYYLKGMKPEDPPRVHKTPIKSVETVVVHPGEITAKITGYGRVSSVRPIDLASEVSGKLQDGSVPFLPGQTFSKGDLLIKVDDRQTRLSLNSYKADLLAALAQVLPEIKTGFPDEYAGWQSYFDNCEFDKPLWPLPTTNERRVKLYLSRFNVYKIYYAIQDLEIQLEKHYFYAPYDGSIVATAQRAGAATRPGQLLGRIISLAELEVEIPLAVEDIRWLDQSLPVEFASAERDGRWRGRTDRISSAIDSRTQTVSIYVRMDQADASTLVEGVFLHSDLPGQIIPSAVLIPRHAIYNERFVYLVSDGKLEYREVTIARAELNHLIVSGGLEEGDTLVIEMLHGAVPGMPAVSRRQTSDKETL